MRKQNGIDKYKLGSNHKHLPSATFKLLYFLLKQTEALHNELMPCFPI